MAVLSEPALGDGGPREQHEQVQAAAVATGVRVAHSLFVPDPLYVSANGVVGCVLGGEH